MAARSNYHEIKFTPKTMGATVMLKSRFGEAEISLRLDESGMLTLNLIPIQDNVLQRRHAHGMALRFGVKYND